LRSLLLVLPRVLLPTLALPPTSLSACWVALSRLHVHYFLLLPRSSFSFVRSIPHPFHRYRSSSNHAASPSGLRAALSLRTHRSCCACVERSISFSLLDSSPPQVASFFTVRRSRPFSTISFFHITCILFWTSSVLLALRHTLRDAACATRAARTPHWIYLLSALSVLSSPSFAISILKSALSFQLREFLSSHRLSSVILSLQSSSFHPTASLFNASHIDNLHRREAVTSFLLCFRFRRL